MNRKKLLELAIERTVKPEGEYGTPENNFEIIAAFWEVYLRAKYQVDIRLHPVDVALMMDLLKTARLIKTPTHLDSWVDKGGYSACGAEVSNA